jgi:stress response protein YsnF
MGRGAMLALPVIVEELDDYARRVATGPVRITPHVQAREVLVDEPLWRDEVDLTRVPVQRVVDGPIAVCVEGRR